ncbi:hypothetical protein BDW42DRAFT_190453 [Aspergillus taichungensis]|uniref:Uncharacterized protein n=1 Tax=Aspergillus taichungensis TaxID=482145 RepID=A0A2J5I7L4_9EURO|nr:hypothetical protein BDW42DRAFT_190453 [Aspergillus taichungensis]
MLGVSVGHECRMRYAVREEAPSEQRPMSTVEVDIGDDADEEELIWWRAVLCSTLGWDATTTYNGRDYISPWSVAAKDAGLTLTQTTRGFKPHSYSHPPGSATALEYLSRFCVYHRLYAQCSVALAGALYIPFQRGRTVYLPFPKPALRSEFKNYDDDDDGSIPDLLNQHSKLLPQYMTLSSNVWGLRSILHSTVFNIDIECNLVNAWLNPAFAAIESLSSKEYPTSHREVALAILLTNRHPRLGILWLGAILTNLARSILRDVKAGMTAVDLPASAWVGAAQTFLTAAVGTNRDSGSIPREDEYRLLFLTASEGHDRPPVWPWRPFATTGLCDTELAVRKHAGCACHGLEYESREWMLTDDNNDTNGDTTNRNSLIHQIGEKPTEIQNPAPRPISPNQTPTALDSYQRYDLSSRSLSESATRNIFGWLRSTGYPLSERDIYQHSWIDVEDTDEEESAPASDDADLNRAVQQIPTKENGHVEDWLEDVE